MGAFDTVMTVEHKGLETRRAVAVIKNRNGAQGAIGTFTLVPVVLGKDEDGDDITSMVVSMGGKETILPKEDNKNTKALNEAFGFGFITDGVLIDGREAVSYEVVRGYFKHRSLSSQP